MIHKYKSLDWNLIALLICSTIVILYFIYLLDRSGSDWIGFWGGILGSSLGIAGIYWQFNRERKIQQRTQELASLNFTLTELKGIKIYLASLEEELKESLSNQKIYIPINCVQNEVNNFNFFESLFPNLGANIFFLKEYDKIYKIFQIKNHLKKLYIEYTSVQNIKYEALSGLIQIFQYTNEEFINKFNSPLEIPCQSLKNKIIKAVKDVRYFNYNEEIIFNNENISIYYSNFNDLIDLLENFDYLEVYCNKLRYIFSLEKKLFKFYVGDYSFKGLMNELDSLINALENYKLTNNYI